VHYLNEMRLHVLVASGLAISGCHLISPPEIPIESGVTFAAHAAHGKIVIDRMPEGGRGEVAPAGLFHWGGAPTFVVTRDDQPLADLWLTSTATAEVAPHAAAADAARSGIVPAWDENTIRFTLNRPNLPVLHTDVFARTTSDGGPGALSRTAQTSVDVRGTYRAPLRDPGGAEIGWLRVRISPYQEASRIYDGVLPADLGTGVAAGMVVALSSEIDWIQAHTLDVYHGSMTDGPLQQSVPMGR
jgi:hypothetical protein